MQAFPEQAATVLTNPPEVGMKLVDAYDWGIKDDMIKTQARMIAFLMDSNERFRKELANLKDDCESNS